MMEIDESNLNQPSTSHGIVLSGKSESFSTHTLSGTTNSGSDLEYEPPIPTKRAKINVLTPEVVSALDRANVSSRNAMFIIAPVLSAVGIKIEDTTLSYRSIQRARMVQRKDIAQGLKDNFKTHDKYVVHWDGKMLNDLIESKSVERLPVLLTAYGTEQLLGVPIMNSGTAVNQTSAILSTLSEWGIIKYVKAMCFDTTAVNTGIHNGTCKEIEKILGRELIWLSCRHHIFEVVLRGAFEVFWPVSSGPNRLSHTSLIEEDLSLLITSINTSVPDPVTGLAVATRNIPPLNNVKAHRSGSSTRCKSGGILRSTEQFAVEIGFVSELNLSFKEYHHPRFALDHILYANKINLAICSFESYRFGPP
ncbi:uncharacterized protein LOC141525489 [Cotesia typhae]|uniref:uncharacterized protein LOC141525489 n=1 Tax=Cotesia typhae TaxID=2053667 RepID=UPI003D68E934